MPFISREFTHMITDYNNSKIYYNYGKPEVNLINSTDCNIKATQFFFDDLKTLIEEEVNSEILSISFSENLIYDTTKDVIMPYLNVFGLKISPIASHLGTHISNIMLVPYMIRHYSVNGGMHYKTAPTISDQNGLSVYNKAKVNKNTTEFEINYIIEIYYNTDFLIINYRPYHDKTIKFTMCCLIKGIDINNKDVVYESGGCNTVNIYTPLASSVNDYYKWQTYHKISWPEYPYGNPYTKAGTFYPSNENYLPTNHNNTFNTGSTLFIDLINNISSNTKLHDSGITHEKSANDNVILYKPYCCNGNIEFSDNILTGPMNLALDTEYIINDNTYYCPGEYVGIMSQQNDTTYITSSMRFLLKL